MNTEREDGKTRAATDVMAERQRQVEAEGWTPEHDDRHRAGEMAAAAGCYALSASPYENWSHCWPWDGGWWKPTTRRRNLVKAGALILAEIERLDRADIANAKAKGLEVYGYENGKPMTRPAGLGDVLAAALAEGKQ